MNELIARHPFAGSGSFSAKYPDSLVSIVIYNDSTEDLTFKAGPFESVVRGGDVFDERIDPFRDLTITGSGAFHGYCRANQ